MVSGCCAAGPSASAQAKLTRVSGSVGAETAARPGLRAPAPARWLARKPSRVATSVPFLMIPARH
jgi:hypothetical protein